MQHYKFRLLANNEPSVLARVASLFAAKGCNIETVKAQKTDNTMVTEIKIVAECNEQQVEQLRKQLSRLIDIIKMECLT